MDQNKPEIEKQGILFPEYDLPDNLEKEISYRNYAIIKPEMLTWGREYAYLSIADAAQKIGVQEEKLKEWENGISRPTINQLHKIANIYKQLFAVFFFTKSSLSSQIISERFS